MPEYTVYFEASESISVRVDLDIAPGVEDYEIPDIVLDAAYDLVPGDVCAHCSGWNQNWSRDSGEPEASEVEDPEGVTIWKSKPDE